MKQVYLVTTAGVALLAGTLMVAAQGNQGMQRQAPEGAGQGQMQREPGPAHDQKGKQQAPKEQGREQSRQPGTTGQGAGDQREPREQGKQGKQGQSKEKAKTGETQREPSRNQTTGQGQKDKQGQAKEGREGQRDGQTGQNQQGQSREGQSREGQTRDGSSGRVTLTTEQRTRVRETVLTKGPRANNVNFAINIGVEVPRAVHVVAVDPILIEYYPTYRGHFYFIVNDQIIIVNANHRIVAVINV